MSYNVVNSGSYLSTTRSFPADSQALSVELSKSYVDIANAVNERSIGVFATVQTITGNAWFLGNTPPSSNNAKQQSVRQVFKFTAAGNIPHGLNLTQIGGFVDAFGSFTDNTNWYGAIYAGSSPVGGQVSFYITPSNVVVVTGAGAPTIVSGTIVLEWVSKV